MIRIERLGIGDAARLDEIRRDYAVELGGAPRADPAFTERLLGDPAVRVWGAFDGDTLAGFAVVMELPDAIHCMTTGMMDDLFVARVWRRRGVARALIHAIVEHGKSRSWSHLRWLVREDDDAAIALYDRVSEQVALRSYIIRLDRARSV